MSRKKWDKSQLWKKLVSGTISLSLFLTFFPLENVNAYEERTDRSVKAMKEWVEKYQQELNELDLGINKVKDGVDVSTEEYQSIIIEFNSLPRITDKALDEGSAKYGLNNNVERDHNEFNKFLLTKAKEKSAAVYEIEHSYYDTFNGVAMKVKGIDIPALLESGVVKSIWKDEEVRVEPSVKDTKSVDGSSSRMVTSTPLIGVDKLREEGITGKGIKVGILDTGIDYNHPDLKDNYKEGGYDFVDKDNDPMETTYEDWRESESPEKDDNGNSYYTYHGTHVSGTIGASGNNSESEFAVTGIAPEAELYGYRVLGPFGVGSSSDIIAAIEQSVKDGMDVINLSLGITTPNPLYPSSIACNNAAIAGVVPIVANGNAGPGASTLGSPGTSPLAISVGASTTNISIDKFTLATSNGVNLEGKLLARPFDSINNLVEQEYEIVYGNYGFDYELSELDVEGKILLIDRGYLSFADKFEAAKNAKAAAVIIANNVEGEMGLYFGESVSLIPGISISMEDGQALKKALGVGVAETQEEVVEEKANVQEENLEAVANEPIKIKLDFNGKTTTEADKLADFSSRGPSSDETIKPDITAPGVGIFSTYPEYINSPEDGIDYSTAYARIDGTSMAAPHVAGVAALMLQSNKDLTPEQIKVAMMNTAEKLAQDYAVNAMGAGRINAYEAVHTDVAIKVLDECQSFDENNNSIDIDYITGSMSFDRISKSEKDSKKEMNLEVINSGNEEKTFNISVEFSGANVEAQDAKANGVTLELPTSVTVASGNNAALKATIKVPAEAALGRYEGFVIFKNANKEDEDYRIPFSVKYLTPGIEKIEFSRPAISNDLEMMHSIKEQGITAYMTVSSPIDSVEIYIRDYETKELVGFAGEIDVSYLPPGYSDNITILDGRASYFPMDKAGNLDYVRSSLRDGKYTIDVIANDGESDAKYEFNYDVLVDNEDVKLDMDIEPGVHEISEDMLTVEEYLGSNYEAFWLKGNASDNSIPALNEMGYKVDGRNITILGVVNGMPHSGVAVEANGDFKIGIEQSDLENGIFEFSPMPTDIATSQNLFMPPRYFFIKAGAPYYGSTLDKKEILEGESIIATINTNNVTGSKFETKFEYADSFEIEDIKVNAQLQKILDENQYKVNIRKNISGFGKHVLSLNIDVTDKNGKPVNISGDESGKLSLVDVKLNLVSDAECDFGKEYLQCISMNVADKDNNPVEISYKGYYEGVGVKLGTSTLKTFQMSQGYYEIPSLTESNRDLDKYLWVEDANGKKYDVFYDTNYGEYRAFNLPKTTEDLRLISAMPGHFKKTAKFIPSRTLDGELVGKVYYLLGSEYHRNLFGGDVNGDGLIDIHDALEVEKYYGQKVDYNKTPVDFNFDGVVNAFDMDYIVYNFTEYNEQVVDRGEPEVSYEGRNLEDILEATGYYEEVTLEGMDIDKTYMELEVGATEKITAVLKPDNIQGIGFNWSSSNEKVATVDKDGNVTAVGTGYASIKVETTDGRLALGCQVNVSINGEFPKLESVTIDEPAREVFVRDEFELNFEVKSYDSLVNSVDYVSSASSIVSVKDGKAVANKPGKAFVSVSVNGGEFIETWEITVKEKEVVKVPLESIKLSKNTLRLKKGQEEQLNVTFKPENADNKNVAWKSSDEKVATVVDGKVVAVGKGEAVITVTSEDGGYTDTCKVKVKEKDSGKPENPENPDKPDKPNLPQTGAAAGASMAMVMGLVGIGAGVVIRRKRNN
ncbi:MAG: S8 family serine peptidase [Clostridium sp.]